MKLLSRKEELILLMIYRLGDQAYGISIRDELERCIGVKYLFGSIYTPLTKLFDKGLIKKTTSSIESVDGRSRVHFHVTPKGTEALARIKEVNTALWTDIPPLNMK